MTLARCGWLLPLLVGFSGCRVDATDAAPIEVEETPPERQQRAELDAGVAPDPSAALFDDRQVPRFALELAPEALASLRRDPDGYVRATLRYESETLREVGVRIKGEGSLRTLDRKAAFKLRFDAFVDGQTFRGLSHLTLNNMVEDPSFLAERLAYHVFRAVGLPAPRCHAAWVTVNGADYGLYANVESEDETFLRRWFRDARGNLYEEGQVDFERGMEGKFDLETNEDEDDRSDLRRLIEAVNTPSRGAPLARWAEALDVAHFLRFTAAEAAVNQWDMYAYTMFYPNNFRLYHDPSSRQFVFLPWGMDLSMKPYRDSGRKHVAIFALSRQYDRPNGKITAGLLFRQCLEDPTCKARYAAEVRALADRYEGLQLAALASRYYAQIAPLVRDDPRKEYTLAQFEAGYRALLETIRTRPQAMRADLRAAGF